MEKRKYIVLKNLEVYQLSRQLSKMAWPIFDSLPLGHKKVIGDQFIRAVDSVGANIAEGYARFHYLEKIRFYHFARGSLSEAIDHWAELMLERKIIDQTAFDQLSSIHKTLEIKLNNFISVTRKNAEGGK